MGGLRGMPKAESAFSRSNAVYDTTIGWRFVNKLMKEMHGVDSMKLLACESIDNDGVQMTWLVTVEREGSDKPVCVAESLSRRYP